jgi:hypothetical protein
MTIDRLDRYARCFRDTVHRRFSVSILKERLTRSLDNSASLPLHQRSFRIIGAPSFHQYRSAFLLPKTDAFLTDCKTTITVLQATGHPQGTPVPCSRHNGCAALVPLEQPLHCHPDQVAHPLCRPRSDSVWPRWATNLLRLLAKNCSTAAQTYFSSNLAFAKPSLESIS